MFSFSCSRNAYIYSPDTVSFYETSQDDVEKAIIRACYELGWMPRKINNEVIEANLNIRSHQATVNIYYTTNSFHIDYYDSYNLNYNGYKIHKNYNSWVRNLEKRILSELVK